MLESLDQVASIATALLAGWAYGFYSWAKRRRRLKLESYLAEELRRSHNTGTRTVFHLMAELGMTEQEILEAAFSSDKVEARMEVDHQTGRTTGIMFRSRSKAG